MNKYQIIEALEGKEVQTPDSLWHLVSRGRFQTRFGSVALLNHGVEMLEAYLRTARNPRETALPTWVDNKGSIEDWL